MSNPSAYTKRVVRNNPLSTPICMVSFYDMNDTLTKTEKVDRLKEWFTKTKLDEGVTKQTINVPSGSVSPSVMLNSSSKLIKLNRREVEPDDRDNLKYSKFLGVEDYVAEHVEKDHGGVQKKALQKIKQKRDLSWLHAGFFTPQIKSVVINNQLSQNIEGINPLENYDVSNKVSKMGQGGITDATAIPDESRQVNSSQFGFFDPFHMVESETIGVVNYFTRNVRKGKDGKLYRLMLDKEDKPVWVDHETILNSKVEIPEH